MQDNSVQSSTQEDRTLLAQQEGQLINALLGLSPAPQDVDTMQVEICGLTLKRKRARTLARFLGDQDTTCSIAPEMEKYFKEHPGVHPDGPCADFRRYQKFMSRGIFHRLLKAIQRHLANLKSKT